MTSYVRKESTLAVYGLRSLIIDGSSFCLGSPASIERIMLVNRKKKLGRLKMNRSLEE
jgi:hypothetical protein